LKIAYIKPFKGILAIELRLFGYPDRQQFVGFKLLCYLHRFELAKPGSSGHDPDFSSGEVKRITGLSEPVIAKPWFSKYKKEKRLDMRSAKYLNRTN